MPILDHTKQSELAELGVLLNRDLPETAATKVSTDLNAALKSAGWPAWNLGQGAETEIPQTVLDQLPEQTISGKSFDCVYPKPVGGRARVKEAAQGIIKRYFGIDTHQIAVINAHGRDGLFKMLLSANAVADVGAMEIAIPEFHWPMYKAHVRLAKGSSAREYPNPDANGVFDPASLGDVNTLQAIIVNPEHNPTGKVYPKAFVQGLVDYIEGVNKARLDADKQPIFIALDPPYFHSRDANPNADIDQGECYYDSPIGSAINDAQYTPVAASIPGTKAWGTAAFGMTILAGNQRAMDLLNPALLVTNGLAGFDEVFNLFADFMAVDHDQARLAFEAHLRSKYQQNKDARDEALADLVGASLVDGDAGMTCLLKLELNHFFGKTVMGEKTGAFSINEMNDIIEYLALNHGIVTVNNGSRDGLGFLRLANALKPENYAEAMVHLKTGLEALTQVQSE